MFCLHVCLHQVCAVPVEDKIGCSLVPFGCNQPCVEPRSSGRVATASVLIYWRILIFFPGPSPFLPLFPPLLPFSLSFSLRVGLCSPGCPGTHWPDQSPELWEKACLSPYQALILETGFCCSLCWDYNPGYHLSCLKGFNTISIARFYLQSDLG